MPRAGLTPALVVAEAERIADEEGLSGLTLAALAQRLGVRQPSLYKHVDGLPGLLQAIGVAAKRELAETLARAAVGTSRDDAVRAMAGAYRDWAHRHPGRYDASLRAPVPGDGDDEAASAAAVEVVLAVLSGYGLQGPDAIDAVRALRAALHGFVALEAAGAFGLPQDVDRSYDRLVEGYIAVVSAAARSSAG